MAYPSNFDSFPGVNAQGTSPLTSPDHALDHRTLGNAVGAVEKVLGLTSGTNVLSGFNPGDQALRISNASGILQQQINGGTINANAGTFTNILFSGTATNTTITDSNSNLLATSLKTSGGSVAVSGASAPTAGQVLTAVNGTSANWQTASNVAGSRRGKVRCNSAFSIPNNAATAVTFDTADFDTDSMTSIASTPTKLIFTHAGVYSIQAGLVFAANTTGRRYIQLRVNGATVIQQSEAQSNSSTGDMAPSLCVLYNATAADYVELLAFQASGGALNTGGGAQTTFLSGFNLS